MCKIITSQEVEARKQAISKVSFTLNHTLIERITGLAKRLGFRSKGYNLSNRADMTGYVKSPCDCNFCRIQREANETVGGIVNE